MSVSDVIKTALDQMSIIAKTETVIGEPIIAGDVTLIPVSKISVGFAAGGAGLEGKSASGTGSGGGITITPVAFISITNGHVHVHPVNKGELDLGRLFAITPGLFKKVAEFLGKKGDKKSSNESAHNPENV